MHALMYSVLPEVQGLVSDHSSCQQTIGESRVIINYTRQALRI